MKLKQKIPAFLLLLSMLIVMCLAVPYGVLASTLTTEESERISLIPAGTPFGIKFYIKGVIVVGVTDIETYEGLASPAKNAGLKAGDIITKVNSTEIDTTESLSEIIAKSGGDKTVFSVNRSGETLTFDVYPKKSSEDGVYKAGLWVRDSTAGIGTVTYVDANTNQFAGLGHGICDAETGDPLPLLRGIVTGITITDVVKGLENAPGELKGEFSAYKIGSLFKNTESGVFGVFDSIAPFSSQSMEICFRDELKTGKAYILTTVSGSTPQLYEINIIKIYPNSGKIKNFLIEVTDKQLLAKTGGIVQGMSGSPVIQNGRLAGAVTHVMINDPTRGYGIFIENMIDASTD
ncbi:MAG: SpoIVB peptidase [Victivallales bacterium]|nr:SpoIVB peptidase [Eubacteriales bacterium]